MVAGIQYAAAVVLMLAVAVLLAAFIRAGIKETKRRSLLTAAERRALEEEDAKWSQRYGP